MDRSLRSNAGNRLLDLPRTVWLLGWVSLATDSATEAIYPLLPFFLTQVLGAGAISLGVVEGAAEAVNSLLKVWSGRTADRRPAKRPLVLAGYSISSLARPLIALAQSWTHVFAIRVVDRVGKGIRSAPRDAILAATATPETRGRVFGFHRAMDHAGAVLGPILATAFLYFYPDRYRTLFALTLIPGLIAIALILFVREHARGDKPAERGVRLQADHDSPSGPQARLPAELKSFLLVLTLFTLGNSTDAFLLLKLTDAAGGTRYIPLIWAALHVVKSVSSVLGGGWSDRVGRRGVIASGWLVYAAVYTGFALSSSLPALLAWFMVYGLYFGLTEGTEKALVADLAPASARGYAFGLYNAVLGVGALLASVLFGLLWNAFGPAIAFGTGAALALAATVWLFATVRR
ncbi:MAG: MFS transporter [Vicinamibacterales bacterium]